MAVMNSIYLNTLYSSDKQLPERKDAQILTSFACIFNSWGCGTQQLVPCTFLLTGTIIIAIIFYTAQDRAKLKKVAQAL